MGCQDPNERLDICISLWKDDLGATDHCCKDTTSLEKLIRLTTAGEIDVIRAEGVETIDFIDEQGRMAVLDEVLYNSNILFSPSKTVLSGNFMHSINKKGLSIKFVARLP